MILTLISAAMAMPVAGDAQVALGEKGFAFLKTTIMEIPLSFTSDELSAPYECWDLVGVQNVNLTADLHDIDIQLEEGLMWISIDISELNGENMIVFAEDDDTFDLCPSIDKDLNYFTVEDLHIDMALTPSVENGEIQLIVHGEPNVTGNIDMDINWFPDDLILFFFEGLIFDKISEQLSETLPEILSAYSEISFAAGEGAYEFDLAFTDATVQPNALMMGANFDLQVNETSECEKEALPVDGARPELSFDKISDASLGIGLTEHVVNQGVMDMWASGFFCLDQSDFQDLFDDIKDIFDASAGELQAQAELVNPATISLDTQGMHATISEAHIQIVGGNDDTILLNANMNIDADLSLTVDRSVSSLGIAVHDLTIDFITLEVESILTENPYAEAHLKRFIENWVVDKLEEQLQELTLFRSVFRAAGAYMFIEEIDHQEDGLTTYITLYHASDPAVDLIPPDTEAAVETFGDLSAKATWEALDDRAGDFAYSYRLDGGSWSSWTTDDEILMENLIAGVHSLEVKSRDKWWNEDESPAMILFELSEPAVETNSTNAGVKEQSCGCSVQQQTPWPMVWLISAIGVARLRRKS